MRASFERVEGLRVKRPRVERSGSTFIEFVHSAEADRESYTEVEVLQSEFTLRGRVLCESYLDTHELKYILNT